MLQECYNLRVSIVLPPLPNWPALPPLRRLAKSVTARKCVTLFDLKKVLQTECLGIVQTYHTGLHCIGVGFLLRGDQGFGNEV